MKKFAYIAFPAILFLLPILSFAHTPNVLQGGYWGQGLNPIVSCTAPIVIQKGYYSGNCRSKLTYKFRKSGNDRR